MPYYGRKYNNMENQIFLQSLGETTRISYKHLTTAMLKMARDSKKLVNSVENIDPTELPRLLATSTNGDIHQISFSILKNTWILSINGDEGEVFNPTATTGMLDYITQFESEELVKASNLVETDILLAFNKYDL